MHRSIKVSTKARQYIWNRIVVLYCSCSCCSEEEAKLGARRLARCLQKLGFKVGISTTPFYFTSALLFSPCVHKLNDSHCASAPWCPQVTFSAFKVVNVMAVCAMPFKVSLIDFTKKNRPIAT